MLRTTPSYRSNIDFRHRDRVGKCRRICPEPLHLAMKKEGAQPSLSRSQNLATGISISTSIISSVIYRLSAVSDRH